MPIFHGSKETTAIEKGWINGADAIIKSLVSLQFNLLD